MIRLQRVGRKNDPSFRVVVTDSRKDSQSGKFLEVVGSYDARKKAEAQIKAERVKYWLSVGAQASGTVRNLLVDAKIVAGPKANVSPKIKSADAPVGTPTA
jgi:small subunit ribosomal protein S16